VNRFARGKQVASYLGLIPREHSSGGRQKLGAITKQGNRMLRMLLVEAAQMAVRCDPGMRREYLHRCHQKPKAVAKIAAARKLAVRLYWMLHTQKPFIRKSFASRVARPKPWSAVARPKPWSAKARPRN
jgi:transposase